MKKIITLTLNPALDKSIIIHVPEKKLRCSNAILITVEKISSAMAELPAGLQRWVMALNYVIKR